MNAPTPGNLPATQRPRSVLLDMSMRFGMEPAAFEQTLRATVVPQNCSKEQFAAFLLVAKEYNLNPLTKEIYAFPTKGGGIQPIVSIDGWCNLINSNADLDGIEFDDLHDEKGNLTAITCRIWRKGRTKPISVTEYMAECARQTEPWQRWPRRMLRHKALIQGARYAFGFAGIVDPDEAERMGVDGTPAARGASAPPPPLPPPQQGTTARPGVAPPPPPPPAERDHHVEWSDPADSTVIEGDVYSDADWLAELGAGFSGCEDLVSLGAEQNRLMAPMKGKVTAETWKAAEALAMEHFTRLSAQG